jgi:hypothetical protein
VDIAVKWGMGVTLPEGECADGFAASGDVEELLGLVLEAPAVERDRGGPGEFLAGVVVVAPDGVDAQGARDEVHIPLQAGEADVEAGGVVRAGVGLQVPHVRLQHRNLVLEPRELALERVPLLGRVHHRVQHAHNCVNVAIDLREHVVPAASPTRAGAVLPLPIHHHQQKIHSSPIPLKIHSSPINPP